MWCAVGLSLVCLAIVGLPFLTRIRACLLVCLVAHLHVHLVVTLDRIHLHPHLVVILVQVVPQVLVVPIVVVVLQVVILRLRRVTIHVTMTRGKRKRIVSVLLRRWVLLLQLNWVFQIMVVILGSNWQIIHCCWIAL